MNIQPPSNSRMKLLLILLVALLPATSLHAQAPTAGSAPAFGSKKDERNLLQNANFEQGLEHWELIAFGKKGTMAIDTQELRNGKPTLRIDNLEADHTFVRQILKPKPNTRYRMTGYIKTRNVVPAKPGGDGAMLMLGMTHEMTAPIQKTNAWKKVTFEFTPTPTTPGEIRVGGSLGGYARPVTGTAWFSELTLTEIGPARKK